MAPAITTTVSDDIRVPPVSITDPAILDNFPELFYSSQGRLGTSSLISFGSTSRGTKPITVISGEESASTPAMLSKDTCMLLGVTYPENYTNMYTSGNSTANDGGDLFDSDYVLPDNCQWWQQVEDLSFEAPSGDFEVVDLPHFGYDLNYSSLWEDVDIFVSVVDVTEDDVTEKRAVHEPVYCLDTRRTTVWGLDIIWEEDEEYL